MEQRHIEQSRLKSMEEVGSAPARGIFFLHLNRCGGTSILNMLRAQISSEQIYQCTSPVQNFWKGYPELFDIYNPFNLKVIFGHAVNEEMAKFFEGKGLLVCPLRNPTERLASQIRYHFELTEHGIGLLPSREGFLVDNKDRMCRWIANCFPSIKKECSSDLEAALYILSGFDFVYDISDMHKVCGRIFGRLGLDHADVIHENVTSAEYDDAMPMSDDFLSDYLKLDNLLYDKFAEAQKLKPEANNPLYNAEAAGRIQDICSQPVQWDLLCEQLAEYVAADLFNSKECDRAIRFLHRKLSFSNRLLGALKYSKNLESVSTAELIAKGKKLG